MSLYRQGSALLRVDEVFTYKYTPGRDHCAARQANDGARCVRLRSDDGRYSLTVTLADFVGLEVVTEPEAA